MGRAPVPGSWHLLKARLATAVGIVEPLRRGAVRGRLQPRLQPDRAVLELADEVGVTIVSGVLLDHVEVDRSQ